MKRLQFKYFRQFFEALGLVFRPDFDRRRICSNFDDSIFFSSIFGANLVFVSGSRVDVAFHPKS
jgi:hypothetical protein